MLTFKKIFLITFVFMFIVNSLNAQPASFIDSLKLLPQYPDTSDIIKVVCFYTFPYGPCELDSFSINTTLPSFPSSITCLSEGFFNPLPIAR